MKKSNKIIDVILDIVIGIGLVLCLILLILRIFFVSVVVHGHSMNPNITDGSKAYMVKVNQNTKIERFDIVAANHGDDYDIIKRVIGLPNEVIQINDNVLYVNGATVEQSFDFILDTDSTIQMWTLGENQYLLAGDNRPYSIDPVVKDKSEIIGKNGFSYLTYDTSSSQCSADYSSCPIGNRSWYWFK